MRDGKLPPLPWIAVTGLENNPGPTHLLSLASLRTRKLLTNDMEAADETRPPVKGRDPLHATVSSTAETPSAEPTNFVSLPSSDQVRSPPHRHSKDGKQEKTPFKIAEWGARGPLSSSCRVLLLHLCPSRSRSPAPGLALPSMPPLADEEILSVGVPGDDITMEDVGTSIASSNGHTFSYADKETMTTPYSDSSGEEDEDDLAELEKGGERDERRVGCCSLRNCACGTRQQQSPVVRSCRGFLRQRGLFS